MPKHKSPIERLIDPFSIPAQMNNLGVLIIAYSTKTILARDSCSDNNLSFLNFIYYGSMITCLGTALMSVLYMVGLLDYCINKVMPCGQVCLTLNTVLIFLAGLLYHCAATVFGLVELIWGKESPCVELQMFTQITCWIYFCWVITIILYLVVNVCCLNRNRQIPTVEETYTELK